MDTNYYKKYEPIFGAWKIDHLIGEGSFGKVFEIRREDFGVTYRAALKTITIPTNQSELRSAMADGMDEASVREYFGSYVQELVREFALMSKLKGNSNIVSYENHQVIEHKDGIGWDILIQMELLTPLNDYTSKNTITRQDIIKIGIDMCKALELCQKFNIIHRDVKPENMFISESGDFKLGDFGIARTVEKTSSGLSKKGTYSYMAPEVYKGEDYGSTVDIYSLGVVLYRLLNENRTPFLPDYPAPITHADRENALAKRFSGAPLPLPVHGEGRLGEIVLKACAYDPAKRYSSPAQMRQELEAILYNREDGRYIFSDGDELPQQSIQYVDTGVEPPVSPLDATQKDTDQSFLDETVSEFGSVTDPSAEVDDTVSDFGGTVSDFGDIPTDDGSSGESGHPGKDAVPGKKFPIKGILIGVGVLIAALIALFVWDGSQGTPVLDSVAADYGAPAASVDLSDVTRGFYADILDAVAGEMGYATYPDMLQPEALNAAVQQGEFDVGVSFADPMSEEVQESEPFATDTFVFLTGAEDPVAQVSDLGTLITPGTYRIGVVKDTLEYVLTERAAGLSSHDDIVVFDSASDALTTGEGIDCLFLHKQTAEKIIAQNPEFALCGVELTYSHTFKVGMKDNKLLQKLNDAIAATKSKLADIIAGYITQWSDEEQAAYDQYRRNWAMGLAAPELSTVDTSAEVVQIGVLTYAESYSEIVYMEDQYSTVEIGGETWPVQTILIDSRNGVGGEMAQALIDDGIDVVIEGNLSGISAECLNEFSSVLKNANIPVVALKERSQYYVDAYVDDHSYPLHFAVEYLGVDTVLGWVDASEVQTVMESLGAVYDKAGKYLNGEANPRDLDNDALYIDFDRMVATKTDKDWSAYTDEDRNAYYFWDCYGRAAPVVTTCEDMYDELNREHRFNHNHYYIVQENYGRYLGEEDTFTAGYYNWLDDYGLDYIRAYPTDTDYEYHDLYLAVLQALEMGGDLYQNLENTVFEGLTGSFCFAPGNYDRMVASYVSRTIVHPEKGLISYTMPH